MKRGVTPRSLRELKRRGGRVIEYIHVRGDRTIVNYVTAQGKPRTALLLADQKEDEDELVPAQG